MVGLFHSGNTSNVTGSIRTIDPGSDLSFSVLLRGGFLRARARGAPDSIIPLCFDLRQLATGHGRRRPRHGFPAGGRFYCSRVPGLCLVLRCLVRRSAYCKSIRFIFSAKHLRIRRGFVGKPALCPGFFHAGEPVVRASVDQTNTDNTWTVRWATHLRRMTRERELPPPAARAAAR